MRTALFYDDESTGFPLFKEPSEDPRQPHIFQIAAELVDLDTRRTIASMNQLIKPAGWVIPPDVEALTGVSTERAAMFGHDAKDVLAMFFKMWSMATEFRVAHNEQFDARLVRIAILRHYQDNAFADQWKAGAAFCTCTAATPIVNLPPSEKMKAAGRNNPKQPKLSEAYEFFTGQPLRNAHDAGADVAACRLIYFALLDHLTKAAT
ncbi:3'-5' exonuclease (plasmid) [Herbaspirillum seropedicae]|uniref:3'-5' exonuclease n=1 Tax=Herbaspirillum seropedicae TaxID=964 RepID=UPI0011211308|nr:3'-5' exonuclease [Herbaspirillum seropedicae]QDD62676.1 3'-5' exonuclease [Herbaspirillum seropedicae]